MEHMLASRFKITSTQLQLPLQSHFKLVLSRHKVVTVIDVDKGTQIVAQLSRLLCHKPRTVIVAEVINCCTKFSLQVHTTD